jgi:hypothetical protein
MALSIRILLFPGRPSVVANGRIYSSAGATVDVPVPDAVAVQEDQAQRLMIVGATTDRPNNAAGEVPGTASVRVLGAAGTMYDLTLGKPIFYTRGSNPPVYTDITGAVV